MIKVKDNGAHIMGLILFFIPFWTMAQVETSRDSVKRTAIQHEIGFSGGFTIGSGMAYRFWIKNFGTQITFAPQWMEGHEKYFGGISFYLIAVKTPKYNFFIYQGNHYMSSNVYIGAYGYNSDNDTKYYDPPQTLKNRNLNNGFGIGYEIFRGPGKFNPFGLSMMVGWAAYQNFNQVNITGELALLYKFNRNPHLRKY